MPPIKNVSGQNTEKTGSYQAEFFHNPTDKCCYSNRLFRIRCRKIHQLQQGTTGSHTIAVISTDVEFHYINDKYGYPLGNEILNIVYDELAASSLTLFTTRVFSDVFISIADMERLSNDALLTQIQLLDKRICHRIQDTYHISFFRTKFRHLLYPRSNNSAGNTHFLCQCARRLAKKMISHLLHLFR